jgi:hypothetical protein
LSSFETPIEEPNAEYISYEETVHLKISPLKIPPQALQVIMSYLRKVEVAAQSSQPVAGA